MGQLANCGVRHPESGSSTPDLPGLPSKIVSLPGTVGLPGTVSLPGTVRLTGAVGLPGTVRLPSLVGLPGDDTWRVSRRIRGKTLLRGPGGETAG